MKRIVYILCAAAALVTGLWGCQKKGEEAVKTVDLRYRCQDSYALSASGAQEFTILVASTDPWTVTSEHPDWCMIDIEQGEGSDPELVHTGQAQATTVKVQYYDNVDLDDRVDKIIIQSDYWVGKTITVNQKGSAYLNIPENEMAFSVEKAGGEFTIHISSNQDWSSQVTDGDWISVKEGESGNGDGNVVVTAEANAKELRYAELTVYDRHQSAVAAIKFTQDGVQLVLDGEELRAGYDQASGDLGITSNTKWMVSKVSAADDWFDIVTPSGEGNGKIQLSFTQNDGDALRKAEISVKNVVEHDRSRPQGIRQRRTLPVEERLGQCSGVYQGSRNPVHVQGPYQQLRYAIRLLHLPLERP
jgi:hypothetical protein